MKLAFSKDTMAELIAYFAEAGIDAYEGAWTNRTVLGLLNKMLHAIDLQCADGPLLTWLGRKIGVGKRLPKETDVNYRARIEHWLANAPQQEWLVI